MAIATKSYVKWAVKGSMAMGQVLNLDAEKASIELPTGSLTDVALSELTEITEDEYSASVTEAVEKISKKIKPKKGDDDMSKAADNSAEIQKALETAQAEILSLKEEVSKATKASEDALAAKDKAEKEKTEAEAQLQKIEKERVALARLTKLKELDSVDLVDASEEKALAALAEMPDGEYKAYEKAAQAAYQKLTQNSQTNLAKTTDQTQTDKAKLTDQTQASDTLAVAKVEDDASVNPAVATSTTPPTRNLLLEMVQASLNSESKK